MPYTLATLSARPWLLNGVIYYARSLGEAIRMATVEIPARTDERS